MQLEILRAIQRISNPLLDTVMEGITLFGEQMIIMAVFCAMYWCVDKRLGRFLAVSLGLSLCVNGVLKDIFKVERLFGAEGIVSLRVETATGYSFPSGHTQTATSFWGGIGIAAERRRIKAASVITVLAIGFSRLYLGVHYPLDVLGGMLIGLACTFIVFFAMAGNTRFSRTVIFALCVTAIAVALLIGESADTFKGAGAFFGVIAGLYFEEKLVGFQTDGMPLIKKIMWYSIAMAVVSLCYILCKLLMPQTNPADFTRYAILTFTVTGICPYMFKKFNI